MSSRETRPPLRSDLQQKLMLKTGSGSSGNIEGINKGCLSSEDCQGRKVHNSGVQSGLEFFLPLHWGDLKVTFIRLFYIDAWFIQIVGNWTNGYRCILKTY